MGENPGISVKAAVLYGLAIIVVAFIGVVLGSWFVEWKQSRNLPAAVGLDEWQSINRSLLKEGDPFPVEELLDMDSNVVTTDSVIPGKKTLVLFLSPGCEPCAMAIEAWKKSVDTAPEDLALIGIAAGDLADVRAYRDQHEIPFPVYCDSYMLYAQQYEITAFPTLIGLNEAGQVKLVWHGYNDRYTLINYYKAVSGSNSDASSE